MALSPVPDHPEEHNSHIQLAAPTDGNPPKGAPRSHKLEAQLPGAWLAALWWNSRGSLEMTQNVGVGEWQMKMFKPSIIVICFA